MKLNRRQLKKIILSEIGLTTPPRKLVGAEEAKLKSKHAPDASEFAAFTHSSPSEAVLVRSALGVHVMAHFSNKEPEIKRINGTNTFIAYA